MKKEYYNIELSGRDVNCLVWYLRDHHIYYESSYINDYTVHFEILLNDTEYDELNRYIKATL